MKQYILSIVSLFFLLVGCQQEELIEQQGTGYLSLESLTLQAVSHQPVTRAGVEEGLGCEIYDSTGKEIFSLTPGDEYVSQLIELEVGTYTLKAYNKAYLDNGYSTWTNSELGEAIHYIETSFTIEADKTNYLKVEVPMINFAVCLESIQGEEFFSEIIFTVQIGNRSLQLKKGMVGYFQPVEEYGTNPTLSYYLVATNTDNELNYQEGSLTGLTANRLYEFVYNIKTKTLQVKE